MGTTEMAIGKSGTSDALFYDDPGFENLRENLIFLEDAASRVPQDGSAYSNAARLAAIMTCLGIYKQPRALLEGLVELGLIKLDPLLIEAGWVVTAVDSDTITVIKNLIHAKPEDVPTFIGIKTKFEFADKLIEKLVEQRLKEAAQCPRSPVAPSASTSSAAPSPTSS